MDASTRRKLDDFRRALSEAISDSSEATRRLVDLREEGFSLYLLLDGSGRERIGGELTGHTLDEELRGGGGVARQHALQRLPRRLPERDPQPLRSVPRGAMKTPSSASPVTTWPCSAPSASTPPARPAAAATTPARHQPASSPGRPTTAPTTTDSPEEPAQRASRRAGPENRARPESCNRPAGVQGRPAGWLGGRQPHARRGGGMDGRAGCGGVGRRRSGGSARRAGSLRSPDSGAGASVLRRPSRPPRPGPCLPHLAACDRLTARERSRPRTGDTPRPATARSASDFNVNPVEARFGLDPPFETRAARAPQGSGGPPLSDQA